MTRRSCMTRRRDYLTRDSREGWFDLFAYCHDVGLQPLDVLFDQALTSGGQVHHATAPVIGIESVPHQTPGLKSLQRMAHCALGEAESLFQRKWTRGPSDSEGTKHLDVGRFETPESSVRKEPPTISCSLNRFGQEGFVIVAARVELNENLRHELSFTTTVTFMSFRNRTPEKSGGSTDQP